MRRTFFNVALALVALSWAPASLTAPSPGGTVVLGPFTGFNAPLHPDNEKPRVAYYGTDLGWTYSHGGRIQFLFGDTHVTEKGAPVTPTHDDAYGSIDLAEWPDPARISKTNLPRIKLGQIAGTDRLAAIDPGQPMEGLKTPVGGFSSGTREFGVFITGKPQACDADADCSNGLVCEATLGVLYGRADKKEGLTMPCADGTPGCMADPLFDSADRPVPNSGLCVDRSSTIASQTDFGRVGSYGVRQIVGVRSTTDAHVYTNTKEWLTNKFTNPAIRTVADFVPGRARQDYRNITGGANQRVFLWGRPGFIGVKARDATLGMYFAYADMPAAPDFAWKFHYYTGTDARGTAKFTDNERDAVALDLDAARPGFQNKEPHDIIHHMSIVWVEQLGKWVMFYGGGISKLPLPAIAPTCGVLEVFARSDCKNVELGNGAIHMSTADHPWGPWTAGQDVFVGGNPDQRPVADQYGPGGVLHHPECQGSGCEAASKQLPKGDYGWLYGANIIEEWTRPAGNGVDLIWIASTWNPYRVILLRTRINR